MKSPQISPRCHVLFCAQFFLVVGPVFADDKPVSEQNGSHAIAAEIKGVISQQAEAWNRGSIDDFMEHYWKSDQLTFSSGGKTTRGWNATKDNYKRRYATAEQMGKVTFDQLEVTPLGDSAALVLGRWRLQRQSEPVGGNFSLVFRRIEHRWVIIHDHTSRDEIPPEKKPN